jgi:hypothetical protein
MPHCEGCKLWSVACAIRPEATVAGPIIDNLQLGMDDASCLRSSGFRHIIQQVLPSRVSPYIGLAEIANGCDNEFLSTKTAKPLLETLIIFDDENRGYYTINEAKQID